jgi:benzoyl-CoA-dihydrodiol lyase
VQERALQLAAQSDRPANAKGVTLTPLARTSKPTRCATRTSRWRSTAPSAPPASPCKGPTGAQPTDVAGIEAQGAAWYPLALARELEDAILQMRTNELDIGTWLIKTQGDVRRRAGHGRHAAGPQEPLAGARNHRPAAPHLQPAGCVQPQPVCADRAGSCFAGSLLELALACDRSYHLALPDDEARTPRIAVSEANFGLYPMVTGQSRLQRRFYDEAARAGRRARQAWASRWTPTPRLRWAWSPATRTTSTGPTKCASPSKSVWP